MNPKRMMSYHSRALPSPAATTAFLTRALSALDSTADALIAHLFTVSEDACAFARHPDRRDPAGTRIYQLMSLTRGPHCAYGRLIRWPRFKRPVAEAQVHGGRDSGLRRGGLDAHHEPDERVDGHADHRSGHDPQACLARANGEAGDEQDEIEGGGHSDRGDRIAHRRTAGGDDG